MAKESQRMKDMKKNFMSLHEQGKSIAEIAKIYSLSQFSVYTNLQKIADANNVPRESLLAVVHSPHSSFTRQKKEDFDYKKIQEYASSINNQIDSIIAAIDQAL